MGAVFNANGDYNERLDVRSDGGLTKLLRAQPKKGVLFPLVGARRAGKTWALSALELLVGNAHQGGAAYVDLRRLGTSLPTEPQARCLLLDEPELTAPGGSTTTAGRLRNPLDLLRWCEGLHAKGKSILLAMSPAEWVELRKAGEPQNLVSSRDLRFLPLLTDAQAQKLARTGWARALLPRIPEAWRRRPFLLELLFQFVEDELGGNAPEGDVSKLLDLTREWSETERFGYFRTVFWNGLDEEQRKVVRSVSRRESVKTTDAELLDGCSILEREGAGHVIGDPILAADLYPLRIHHVSDVHFGHKAAKRVDVKGEGEHIDAMKKSLEQQVLAEQYVNHVRELHARGRAPHLLIISGDVAEWATSAEYASARAWLGALQDLLAPHPRVAGNAPQVLVAGGNHDVDWKATEGAAGSGYRTRHLAFARAFDDVPRSLRTRLEEPGETRALAIARYPELGVEVVLLGSAELGGEIEKDPAREAMRSFITELRRKAMDEADEKKAEELHGSVSRIDPGLVHNQDLMRLRQERSRLPVRIAVLHHPVSPLPVTELARFGGLVNAGEVKDALVEAEVCLVLHGHQHRGWFGKEQWLEREPAWVLRIAAAPSLGSQEVREQHGYNEILIAREPGDRERSSYTIIVRRVVCTGASWGHAKTMGPFAPGA